MAINANDLERFRAKTGGKFRLADHESDWLPAGAKGMKKADMKAFATELLSENLADLAELQDRLYASDTHSLLLIFQAMDAAGKDGTIKHVMSGINPQGCQVFSFKSPSKEELDHDFLWRTTKSLPERGRIGIFNRSYYEEVLVVRVHPGFLDAQHIPGLKVGPALWKQRYESINDFEQHLTRNGTVVLKFFLNVSHEEQRERFLARIDDPTKNWKFSSADLSESMKWDEYMKAYQECIRATSTDAAPWWVIPADRKFVARSIVSGIVRQTLEDLNLKYPVMPPEEMARLADSRDQLVAAMEAEGQTIRPTKSAKAHAKGAH
ncbi:MAG: polyphosphate kinase 2 family protein [Actinobacteria bacterium]|nr:polyphosphate kinase 2 family protein [Actinomycetota bacterium]